MKNMAICALCQKNGILRKSHIFPEFFYKPLYNKEHQYSIIEDNIGKRLKKRFLGIYEMLLCENCEGQLGCYENYVSKVLFGSDCNKFEETKNGLLIHELDYKKIKLFQMSLLWRSSITNRSEIKTTTLGRHQEIMRSMIYNENPGKAHEYGVVICYFPKSTEELKDVILPPELLKRKVEGHRIYRAIFNGLCWIFTLSSHTEKFSQKHNFLSENGILPIINANEEGEQFVRDLIREFNTRTPHK